MAKASSSASETVCGASTLPSLYGRLFTYRETAVMSPLENFLSEALADLLGRMLPSIVIEFVADAFLPDAAARAAWTARAVRCGGFVWTRERRLPDGSRV